MTGLGADPGVGWLGVHTVLRAFFLGNYLKPGLGVNIDLGGVQKDGGLKPKCHRLGEKSVWKNLSTSLFDFIVF